MSNVITNLCRPLQVSPAQKAVLMALADRADDDGVAWPSVAWVSEWTCLGRSTVIRAVNALESQQLIAMARAEGRTSRCTIVIGNVVALVSDPSRSDTHTRPDAEPVDGDLEEDNPSLRGTPTRPAAELVEANSGEPDLSRIGTGEPDDFVTNQSQSGSRPAAIPVPQRDTHPSRSGTPTRPALIPPRPAAGPDTSISINKTSDKTKRAREKTSSFDPMTVELPDWMPAETWDMWVRYRQEIKKPITEDGPRLHLGKLAKFRDEGHDPVRVIEAVIENRWQGLYLPKDGSTKFAQAGGGSQAVVL
ncbi:MULTISPECIES: helix-turn-helix domain-containing protein [unclassified Variovorax]|uniref:helix-turn-helix domain-containing protein n=1 Tax=unclassified Variovorax TaxID=663243 RepID=UPI003F457572